MQLLLTLPDTLRSVKVPERTIHGLRGTLSALGSVLVFQSWVPRWTVQIGENVLLWDVRAT